MSSAPQRAPLGPPKLQTTGWGGDFPSPPSYLAGAGRVGAACPSSRREQATRARRLQSPPCGGSGWRWRWPWPGGAPSGLRGGQLRFQARLGPARPLRLRGRGCHEQTCRAGRSRSRSWLAPRCCFAALGPRPARLGAGAGTRRPPCRVSEAMRRGRSRSPALVRTARGPAPSPGLGPSALPAANFPRPFRPLGTGEGLSPSLLPLGRQLQALACSLPTSSAGGERRERSCVHASARCRGAGSPGGSQREGGGPLLFLWGGEGGKMIDMWKALLFQVTAVFSKQARALVYSAPLAPGQKVPSLPQQPGPLITGYVLNWEKRSHVPSMLGANSAE